jgi:4-aminobutyrate aminotransferase-like enzyme
VAVLETIVDERLADNASARGAELRGGLLRLSFQDERIGDVRGRGLMVGVELTRDRASRHPDGDLAARLSRDCADAGLLLLTCGPAHEVVRWLPPLDVTADEVEQALATFGAVLAATR